LRKRHHTRPGKYVMRHYPLFPRYVLIKIGHASAPELRLARGVCRYRPVLADDDGRPWRAPSTVVEAIREAERRCAFDEILHKGDSVTLAFGVFATVRSVLTATPATNIVELLTPLFGGARARIDTARIAHV
jgi:transcription antitermination factor NusG